MKRIFAVILCALLICSLFASCGKSGNGNYDSFRQEVKFSADEGVAAETAEEVKSKNAAEVGTGEKLVKTVRIDMVTREYTACISFLKAAAQTCGGYIESSDMSADGYDERSDRRAEITFRIPADKLEDFLSGAEEKGKVTFKNENVENVTMEYVDIESRIKACKTEQESLLEVLKKANNVADIISVRERLTQVNYEIESYSAKLRVLENQVSYSTVTITVNEVQRVSEEENSVFTEIKNRFLESWDSLVDILRSILVGFVGGLPLIIPFAAIAAAVIIIIKKLIKKRRRKKEIK